MARDRRDFLKLATCAIGGGVGLVTVGPVLRMVGDPAFRTTVTSPTAPIDVGDVATVRVGEPPRKVNIVAPVINDAWVTARDVVLGAAWLRSAPERPEKIVALSAVCPHLGCGIDWDGGGGTFVCPCHDSKFSPVGEVLGGPSKRAMDELPLVVDNGRILLTWKRFKPDIKESVGA